MSLQLVRAAVGLALVPFTVGLCLLLLALSDVASLASSLTGPVVVAICTAVVVGTSIGLWRRYVAWTWPRISATTANTVVLLGHAIIWLPLVDIGCMADLLILGQCLTLIGVWLGVSAALWWGGRTGPGWREGKRSTKLTRCAVYPSVARLVGGMGLMPLLPGVYLVAWLLLDHFTGWPDPWLMLIIHALCALIALGGWLLLWRRQVRWTHRLIRDTAWSTAVLALVIVLAPPVCHVLNGDGAWAFAVPLICLGLWLGVTAWWWRGGAAVGGLVEPQVLKERVRCPECDYSMVGLQEARCPECGQQYRLEELLAHCVSLAG
jgi:hypothetical protein